MIEFEEYVAGSDETEARYRYEAGLGRETREQAERDVKERQKADRCTPPCKYRVYYVQTTLEKLD
jgi:hypothetical protein